MVGQRRSLVALAALVAVGGVSGAASASPTAHGLRSAAAPCSESGLQRAISDGGTLKFRRGCTLDLTSPLHVPAKTHVTIDGNGRAVEINGSRPDFPPRNTFTRAFTVAGSLTLRDVAVAHASALGSGGAVMVSKGGRLVADGVLFADDVAYGTPGVSREGGASGTPGAAPGQPGGDGKPGKSGGKGKPGQGGAVYVAAGAVATMTDSSFTNDQAFGGVGGGGAAGGSGGQGGEAPSGAAAGGGGKGAKGSTGGTGGTGQGGAIYSAGKLTVNGGSFTSDTATGGAGGGGGSGGGGGAGGQVHQTGTFGNGGDAADGGRGGHGGSGQGGAVYAAAKAAIHGARFAKDAALGGPGGSGAPGGSGGSGSCPSSQPADCGGNSGGDGGDGGEGGEGGDGQGGAIHAGGRADLAGDVFAQDQVGGGQVGPDCVTGTGTACGGAAGAGGSFATTPGQAGADGKQGKAGKGEDPDSTAEVSDLPRLRVTTAQLPTARRHKKYAATLHAAGGVTPYRWSVKDLPAGLSLTAASGKLRGKPTKAGTFALKVVVTDPGAAEPDVGKARLTLKVRR